MTVMQGGWRGHSQATAGPLAKKIRADQLQVIVPSPTVNDSDVNGVDIMFVSACLNVNNSRNCVSPSLLSQQILPKVVLYTHSLRMSLTTVSCFLTASFICTFC